LAWRTVELGAEGVDHGGIVTVAAKDATTWIGARLR
jgi:hypothetical protein